VGKHPIPAKSTAYPRLRLISLKEIKEHPAVCKKFGKFAQEPLVGLQDVRDELINDVVGFPRIGVVPIPGDPGYGCWIGIRVFRRLVDRGWGGKVAVLDYGPKVPEETIVDQALKDWKYSSPVLGQPATADWATAQEWEADSEKICKPAKRGSRRRPSGLKVFASLRGLKSRSLRDDKAVKAPESSNETGSADDGGDEERTEN
jgi:hypothetical protein